MPAKKAKKSKEEVLLSNLPPAKCLDLHERLVFFCCAAPVTLFLTLFPFQVGGPWEKCGPRPASRDWDKRIQSLVCQHPCQIKKSECESREYPREGLLREREPRPKNRFVAQQGSAMMILSFSLTHSPTQELECVLANRLLHFIVMVPPLRISQKIGSSCLTQLLIWHGQSSSSLENKRTRPWKRFGVASLFLSFSHT